MWNIPEPDSDRTSLSGFGKIGKAPSCHQHGLCGRIIESLLKTEDSKKSLITVILKASAYKFLLAALW